MNLFVVRLLKLKLKLILLRELKFSGSKDTEISKQIPVLAYQKDMQSVLW